MIKDPILYALFLECHRRFRYENGNLIYKINSGTKMQIGDIAGYFNNRRGGKSYGRVEIFNKPYLIHRLVFLMHNGWLPEQVDHIDNTKDNNRIENLRAANNAENHRNTPAPKTNTSGVKGVCWIEDRRKWRAAIRINGKHKLIGMFKTLPEATIAIRAAREKHHGEFANHGEFQS